jgi:hypothetical protein
MKSDTLLRDRPGEAPTITQDAERIVKKLVDLGDCLTPEDDPLFWKVAVSVLMQDVNHIILVTESQRNFFIEIGPCSHWLRPHQTRWTADGGFAWPAGYEGRPFNYDRLPGFDWSVYLGWNPVAKHWQMMASSFLPKRSFVLRAALPTRTARHNQAVVPSIWLNGSPAAPRKKPAVFYGYRKIEGQWFLTAWSEFLLKS